jgi:hypothetical protein
MNSKINFKVLVVSIILGTVFVLSFSWASGMQFETSLFPVLALLMGFILTGFIIGLLSKGITIVEPGLGSIFIAAIAFFAVPAMHIHGFAELTQDSDWIILLLNAVVLTFIGAWLGEMFQHGELKSQEDNKIIIDWSWVVAGTVFGVTVSIIIAVILDLLLGHNPTNFILPFFLGLLFTGFMNGFKSTGITTKEAGISGFLTMTIMITIVRLTLVTEIEIEYLLPGLVLGYLISLLGGFIGEKVQARK